MSFVSTHLIRSSFLGAVFLLAGCRALTAQEFYTVDQIDQAKAKARATHLPIAWLSSPMAYLNARYANAPRGSAAELTTLALKTLQGQVVIIFQNVDYDLPKMPANMVERIETKDEGNTPPHGDHYTAPKIIYVDPQLVTFLGCTLAPDLRRDREAAINLALVHIHNNPAEQALLDGTAKPTPPPIPVQTTSPQVPATSFAAMISNNAVVLIIVAAGLLVIVIFMATRSRR